jgi:alpha-mannosidase
VVFPSGKDVSYYHSDGKFDVVRRKMKVLPKKKTYWEVPTGIKPHDSFIDVSDRGGGLAVITRGTPEHEVVDKKGRPIAVTLVRSVGWLTRNDNPYRKGGAGPEIETPEAQGHGIYTFYYSIYPHDGDWERAEVYREAIECNTSPSAFLTNSWSQRMWAEFPHNRDDLPNEASFFTVEPDCFVVTATKGAEDSKGLIIRACNLGTRERSGSITLAAKPEKVWRVNLAEKELKRLKAAKRIPLRLRAKEIGTIKVHMKLGMIGG